jgi:hypothetical protein
MPTSFGDFQKANKDLAKFAAGKKTFKLKAKSAAGDVSVTLCAVSLFNFFFG